MADFVLVSESYITHIRIEEDAAYPSSPPPPQSPADNRKHRVIVVAVRKSGRVRMHKARENANGSFSIGKTWVLDDLTIIESFTNAVPATAEDHQNKQRAGGTGFVVTIQKPYYWNAGTAKEKDFFIFSLIKIFKKYTGGRLPELHGFSPQELEQLGGATAPQPGTQARPQAQPARETAVRQPSQEPPSGREPRAPTVVRIPSQEPQSGRAPTFARVPSQEPQSAREPRTPHGPENNREIRIRSPQERSSQERQLHSAVQLDRPLRTARSKDRIYMPGSFPSTDSVNDQTPRTSHPQLRTKRSESPATHATISQQPNFRMPGLAQSTETFLNGPGEQAAQILPNERQSNERTRQNAAFPASLRPGPPGQQSPSITDERSITAVKDAPPPTLSQNESSDTQDLFSQGNLRPDEKALDHAISRLALEPRNGDMRDHSASGRGSSRGSSRGARGPPSLNHSEYSGEHFPDETRPSTAASHDAQSNQVPINNVTSVTSVANDDGLATPQSSTFPPTPPPETPTEEEVHRPGLGPMIKKKSTKEIASMFRKAAAANNAFKPRAGGAAEKVLDEKTGSGDGITAVFQAPSLLKGISQDDVRPVTPIQTPDKQPPTPDLRKEIKPVTVTTSPGKPATPVPHEPAIPKSPEPPKPPAVPDKAQEERRKKSRSDHSAKYAKILGISPSILEGRTFEIETVLNDFGWGEENNERTTFEELESGIRKELSRVEAGSWLGAVDNNDDRALAVGDMMDRVIAECEELDCLLTLYNVELGVRYSFGCIFKEC